MGVEQKGVSFLPGGWLIVGLYANLAWQGGRNNKVQAS